MASIPQQIKLFSQKHDQLLTGLTRNIERGIAEVYSDFISKFKTTLAKGSKEEILKLKDALPAMLEIDGLLEQAGLSRVVAEYRASFATIAKDSLEYFAIFGGDTSLKGIDPDVLNAIIDLHTSEVLSAATRELRDPLERAIISTTIGSKPRAAALSEIFEFADTLTFGQVTTVVDTTFSMFSRQVRQEKAADLDLAYQIYIGPEDSKTRPACLALLSDGLGNGGNIWLDSEISADMVDGLIGDPRIFGGGYNCRHAFYPISEILAEQEGVDASGI